MERVCHFESPTLIYKLWTMNVYNLYQIICKWWHVNNIKLLMQIFYFKRRNNNNKFHLPKKLPFFVYFEHNSNKVEYKIGCTFYKKMWIFYENYRDRSSAFHDCYNPIWKAQHVLTQKDIHKRVLYSKHVSI